MTDPAANPGSADPIPSYGNGDGLFYLWHLQSIGLIGKESEEPEAAWLDSLDQRTTGPARIAIIDNGCTTLEHPNLPKGRVKNRMDFSGFLQGAIYDTGTGSWNAGPVNDAVNYDHFTTNQGAISNELKKVLVELRDGHLEPHDYGTLEDPSDRFSAHGTSTAGLVAAQPEEVTSGGDTVADSKFPTKINYCGVNPVAEIVPINTVYSADYAPVIMALLYAVSQEADVILMPRIVHDIGEGMTEQEILESDDPRVTRQLLQGQENAEKALFESLLSQISKRIPVVIAAGNDGGDSVKYPGSLRTEADEGDEAFDNLFIAGAATAQASLSSYSNGGAHDDVILMPSDDGQIINQKFFRPDMEKWRSRNLKLDLPELKSAASDPYPFTPYGVLTIDIPGQYGYASQKREDTDYRDMHSDDSVSEHIFKKGQQTRSGDRILTREAAHRSLYVVFGGTSAASAILAGVLSLCQNIAKHVCGEPLTGEEMQTLVANAGTVPMERAYLSSKLEDEEPDPVETINVVELLRLARELGN